MPIQSPIPVLTLAAGRTRTDVSVTPPAGFESGEGDLEVSLAQISTDLIFAGDAIEMATFKMGAAESESIDVTPLASANKVMLQGLDQFEANVVVYRSVTDDEPDADDAVYALLGAKGVVSYWFVREVKRAKVPLADGDTGWVYKCRSDNPIAGESNTALTARIPLTVITRRPFTITA